VPADARWSHLQASAKQPAIGKTVDDAMVAIERDNPRFKGVLPKDYARPGLDKHRLDELIDLIATISLTAASEGEKTHRSVDLLGRVYEYFLTRFASAEGKNGGQFYTPSCVVRCLVEMLAPYKGRIYFIHHLALQGMAGFVLANGSMSSNQSGEGDIRRALIEADLVDCMVALPGQLFYSTQIPVCLWFLAKSKNADAKRGFRDRRKQTLFIDARKLGTLIDRVHRELTDADLEKITSTYHAWRGDGAANAKTQRHEGAKRTMKGETKEALGVSASLRLGVYSDVPGFCKSATTAEIAAHGHVLTPGRYVGAEEAEDDGDPFEEKMPRLVAELHAQFTESAKLEQAIKANLRGLGYGG
jgi:type I restriction-modification system DNA methylase subunit